MIKITCFNLHVIIIETDEMTSRLLTFAQRLTGLPPFMHTITQPSTLAFHTCTLLQIKRRPNFEPKDPKGWPRYNDIVYPPRSIDEPQRQAVSRF